MNDERNPRRKSRHGSVFPLPLGGQRRDPSRPKCHSLETKLCASESIGSLFTGNAIDGQPAYSFQVQ